MSVMARFSTEEAAIAYFEKVRWPQGVTCPHCGNGECVYKLTANRAKKIRLGLYKCAECRETFTVKVGTVMEDSHIPLNKWLIAFYMMCASKTQVSALQLQRQLEIGSYGTALFLCHRVRFALLDFFPSDRLSGTVEADETYIGGKVRGHGRGFKKNKTPVVSLVERGGRVRSRVMDVVTGKAITRLLKEHGIEEYARLDPRTGRLATTNTVEGFFGNSKCSLDGTHHNISRRHTNLFYLAELDHKYNTREMTDGERTVIGMQRMEGKRLMLRTPKVKTATEA